LSAGSLDKEREFARYYTFSWSVTNEQFEIILPSLTEAFAHCHKLVLTADGVIPAPSGRLAKMLWLNMLPSVGFQAIVVAARKAVEENLHLSAFHNEPKPHVTLARYVDVIPEPCQNFVKSIEYTRTITVDKCILYESMLSSSDLKYIALHSFSLEAT
jgi:2'-5' RNA ligase